ncbi:MAG: hypothetical protein ACM3ZT_07710 [Bacillota bacterium]
MYIPAEYVRPLQALPRLLAEPRTARRVVLSVIGLATLGVMLYVGAAVVDTVSRDEWRFLPMLREWYAGHFYVQDLFDPNTVQSAHRTPPYKLYLLVNALWFGLDVRLGCWLGALALGAFAWLLYRHHLRLRPEPATAFDHYAFLPAALAVFSFAQTHAYSYELLAVFTIPGSVIFAALWMRLDSGRRADAGWRDAALACASLLAFVLFGAGKNPALAVATLVAAGLATFRPDVPPRTRLARFAWIAAATLLAELVYWKGNVTSPDLGALLAATFRDLWSALDYVLHALGASLVNTDAFLGLAPARQSLLLTLLGGVVLAAAGGALVVYLRTRLYRRSVLPIAFAVFVALYLGELLVGRYGEGTLNGGSPRYVYTDHLLILGCVLVFADLARGWHRAGRRRAAAALLAGLTLTVVSVEAFNVYTAAVNLRFGVHAQELGVAAAKARLAGGKQPYPAWYCPDRQACDEGTRLLAEHRLNFMRQDTKP